MAMDDNDFLATLKEVGEGQGLSMESVWQGRREVFSVEESLVKHVLSTKKVKRCLSPSTDMYVIHSLLRRYIRRRNPSG